MVASTAASRRRRRAATRSVGLDIGSQSIKLVEVERTANGLRLIKSLIQELPMSAEGQAVDRVGWLQSALKEFETPDVHVTVTGPDVAVRRVHIPLMSARELREAVKWQVKDQLPFAIQEAVIDFRLLGDVWEKDIKKQDLLVAAAAKPYVQAVIDTVQRAGARVASLTPTAIALWSSARTFMPEVSEESLAIIEVGAETTHVVIVKAGSVCVARDLALGSQSITHALVGAVSAEQGNILIDVSKAEALKRQYGVLTETSEGATEEGVPLFHMASLMRPVLENLLTELSRFLDFYKVQMEEGGVSRIFLCGGGANLKSLQSFLAEGLGVTVETFNPIIRITDRVQPTDPEQLTEGGPRLAAALGAALHQGQQLNLLPDETRQARTEHSVQRILSAGLKGVAAVVGVALLLFQLISWGIQRQINETRRAWMQVEPAYANAVKTTATIHTLQHVTGSIEGFLVHQPVWEGLLKEFSEIVPDSIELDELSVTVDARHPDQSATIHLKGRASVGERSAEAAVAQLVTAMNASRFFEHVELTHAEMHASETRTGSFEVEGLLQ